MKAATLIPTLALAAAIAAPRAAHADPFRPSIKDQIELGRRASDQVRDEEKVLGDADPRVKEIRRIGSKLLATIPADERKAKPFEYSFDVIDSKDINAFTFPGGPIFFYTGLLDRFTTEDQVAGVLAHEITHARNQHWASAYADNQKRQLGITALLMILGAGGTAFDIASVADTLLFTLPYSRKHESEADRVGLDMMIQAGFNPNEMAESFRILEKSNKDKTEEWMSTHPDTGKRITAIEKMVKDKGSNNWPAPTKRAANVRQGVTG
jgi:predicted Zn-dependent protease